MTTLPVVQSIQSLQTNPTDAADRPEQPVLVKLAQLDQYLTELAHAVQHIDRAVLQQAAEAVVQTWRANKTVFVMGNGGSASTAGHMVADLNKNTMLPGRPRLKVVSLVDNSAWMTALGGGEIIGETAPFGRKNSR